MDRDKKEIMGTLYLILQIAISMMVPIALGALLGWLVGKWLNAGYVILIGIALGISAGYRNVYDLVKKYLKDPKTPVTAKEPTEAEIRRKYAEEEFNRWKQEREDNE